MPHNNDGLITTDERGIMIDLFGHGLCVHCGDGSPGPRRRGLCPICYRKPEIRSEYPVESRNKKSNDRGHGHPLKSGQKRKMPKPTDALPGTEEKIRVLMKRARKSQHLWHPQDAKMGDEYPGDSMLKFLFPELRERDQDKESKHESEEVEV